MENKKVAYQVLQFLEGVKAESPSSELDTAIEGISKAFDVNASSVDDFVALSYYPSTISTILQAGAEAAGAQTYEQLKAEVEANPKWDAYLASVKKTVYFDGVEEGTIPYLERHAKVLQKFKAKLESSKPGAKKVDPDAEKAAEAKKAEGNEAVQNQDYNAAVRLYTEAIELSPSGPNSHIFFSNRAAAHCHLTSYELAISDCEASIALNPSYAKGYTRLGMAQYAMKNFDAAVEAYKKCCELEPKNKSFKDSLSQAKQKALEYRGQNAGLGSAGGADGGDFDMSALAGAMGAGGKGGPNLQGMMNNPAVMKAAQDMMGNGKMESMMKNPQMMQMAQKLMQNPQMMQQAMSMLGGAGGAGGGMPDLSALAGMMGGDAGLGTSSGSSGGFFDEDPGSSASGRGKGKKGSSSSSSSGGR